MVGDRRRKSALLIGLAISRLSFPHKAQALTDKDTIVLADFCEFNRRPGLRRHVAAGANPCNWNSHPS